MSETPATATVELNGKRITLTEVPQGEGFILRFSGTEVKPDGRLMAFHDKKGKHGFASVMFTLEARPKGPTFQERLEKLGPGPGTEGLRMFHEIGMTDCSECWRLAKRMNEWGVEGCRKAQNWSYILVDALPRALKFWDNASIREKGAAWAHSTLGVIESAKIMAEIARDKESGITMLLGRLFTEAIDRAEGKT